MIRRSRAADRRAHVRAWGRLKIAATPVIRTSVDNNGERDCGCLRASRGERPLRIGLPLAAACARNCLRLLCVRVTGDCVLAARGSRVRLRLATHKLDSGKLPLAPTVPGSGLPLPGCAPSAILCGWEQALSLAQLFGLHSPACAKVAVVVTWRSVMCAVSPQVRAPPFRFASGSTRARGARTTMVA